MEDQLELELLEQLASVIPYQILVAMDHSVDESDATEDDCESQISENEILIIRAANVYIQLLQGIILNQNCQQI